MCASITNLRLTIDLILGVVSSCILVDFPNQIRANGNVVEDVPRQFDSKSRHGMLLRNEEFDSEIFIPFRMRGVILVIEGVRKPTKEELENSRYFYATSEAEWDPYSEEFEEKEKNISQLRTCDPKKLQSDVHFCHLDSINTRNLTEVAQTTNRLLIV